MTEVQPFHNLFINNNNKKFTQNSLHLIAIPYTNPDI